MFDNHTHTKYSLDSTMLAEDAIKKAKSLGLDGIAFTDHVDYDYPDYDDAFNFDIFEYSAFIDKLIKDYSGTLKILKGVEIGLQPHVYEKNVELAKKVDFDFIIGSVHIIDHMDPYSGTFFVGKTKVQAYSRYLQAIYDGALTFKDYDVIGHIGYVRRYGEFEDRSMDYKDYSDVIDAILKTAIQDGKGIEVNTSGLRGILGSTIPDKGILTRYMELGGEIITVGSDAHNEKDVGANFSETLELLREIGVKYTCHFEKRRPVFEKL